MVGMIGRTIRDGGEYEMNRAAGMNYNREMMYDGQTIHWLRAQHSLSYINWSSPSSSTNLLIQPFPLILPHSPPGSAHLFWLAWKGEEDRQQGAQHSKRRQRVTRHLHASLSLCLSAFHLHLQSSVTVRLERLSLSQASCPANVKLSRALAWLGKTHSDRNQGHLELLSLTTTLVSGSNYYSS